MKAINSIPILGFGTWNIKGNEGQTAIEHALNIGYRHIDTADYYRNHDIVGAAIKNSRIAREEIYLVTKVFPPLGKQKTIDVTRRSLVELQTNYIDLMLIHWPDGNSLEGLVGLQQMKQEGLIKNIGVSNFGIGDLTEALESGIKFINNQIEIYPGESKKHVVEFCNQHNISVTAYSPLAQGAALNVPEVLALSKKHNATSAQVILSWLMAKDLIVIPKSVTPSRIEENFAAKDLKLDAKDIELLDQV